ncbi:hypothetical protein [Bacillus sp. MRMR6]|uniref:hypothetical protein n=1 Tax=Bacillus sp. MRMR6 TaxID=1928617 RepID=UPI000951F801|nr:hypothetical protein [Bacillus sp. MRMR6]OLS39112.1 hypothetical protein BTR25_13340 [Bacillus sp. MRMR6]
MDKNSQKLIDQQQVEINYYDAQLLRARNEIAELKKKSRFATYEKMLKENTALAQEVARLKGVINEYQNSTQLSRV